MADETRSVSEIPEDYKVKVRKCNLDVREGGGSDNYKKVVYVDWRPVLHPDEPDFPLAGCEFELGFDPTADPGAWIDPELKWAPAPVWAHSEVYIQALEARIAQLEGGTPAAPKSIKK